LATPQTTRAVTEAKTKAVQAARLELLLLDSGSWSRRAIVVAEFISFMAQAAT
tara:strand:+ start:55 stop:213 length:159 start_codon:yes stop_codon:yes gene_type:complete